MRHAGAGRNGLGRSIDIPTYAPVLGASGDGRLNRTASVNYPRASALAAVPLSGYSHPRRTIPITTRDGHASGPPRRITKVYRNVMRHSGRERTLEPLTDEEIRALLDHPWDVDYQSLDPQHFWKNVLDYLPAALASEARTRLADVIGEAANLLQVRPLEFSSLLESHPIFLQKAFSSCGVGARYFAYASCGLTDKQRARSSKMFLGAR